MRRRVLASALTGLALVTQLTGVASARPGVRDDRRPQTGTPAGIGWSACGAAARRAECAGLKVPVDWAHPGGQTLSLAIGRLKARDPAKRLGVLVVHPNGPGASGLDAYIHGRTIPDGSPLRRYFDVVSMDPRGVGRSSPVLCSADLVERSPQTYPATEAEYRGWLAYNARLSTNCRERTGDLFDHVDTTSAARDVDAIRAALGEREISFYASSYGTQVGQQYAELFPGHVRAMALESIMDHSIISPYDYLKTMTEDFESSLRAFSAWCHDTATCALHGRDATALWDHLYRRAKAGTLADPQTGVPMSDEELRVEVLQNMYLPSVGWFRLASRLDSLVDGRVSRRATDPPPEPGTVNYAYPAIWCSDWKWNVRSFAQLDGYRRRLKALAPHTELSPFWSDVVNCLNWRGRVSNPQHRLRITGTPPILLVKARHDVATPAVWTYAAARQMPSSVILEYDGIGHGQSDNSACARAHIAAYLINRTIPPPGTRCAPEYSTRPPTRPMSVPDPPPTPLRNTHDTHGENPPITPLFGR
ncbi:alpha/beta hydrolase [Nonomuraea lactucae]|uniref:alpha/beta hydrolase n=1 Tax=Nonomuraea lactucae TaxID=2249762 RepID=UPI0013B43246|nr:alpha/beta hydrolase [Nonomuraea lactucae]